ncbi:MAG: penicillin-binding protein 2 [Chitinophagia bacterium]|nr:penicillin-binding protein 2 [Chitinophagia bacterium]
MDSVGKSRQIVITIIFICTAVVMLVRLFFLQNFESKYKAMANDIAIYKKVVYPPRGIIYDRKGKVMLSNTTIYDLVVTPSNIKQLDTVQLCLALGMEKDWLIKQVKTSIFKNGYVRQSTFMEQLSPEQTARFLENAFLFTGFELVERSIRTYPKPYASMVLGYIGEVSLDMLKKTRFVSYRQGDYTGLSGLEFHYEEALRGQRGVHFLERDKFNRPRDSYKDGTLDTPEVSGKSLELYLDADLQEYAEKLMVNKIGSVVAIDPKTGGILAMVSSPTYDPNLLRGRDRSKNYAALYREPTRPLFNRATQATYPPGSTIKPMTGLVALNIGAITPNYGFPCFGGYYYCSRRIGCEHSGGGHAANFREALAHSCNSYFCHAFRLTVDYKDLGGVKKGLQKWHDYYSSFGFGHPIGIDIPFEKGGMVPDSNFYNKLYRGSWNSCTIVFVGMGQGELLLTPMQMANAMCIIANKGYYYTPHFVKSINKNEKDSLLMPYLQKRVVLNIPNETFDLVQRAMQDVVERGTAVGAAIPGIEICAKTGTAENKAIVNGEVKKMPNHSMFVTFAPRNNPKIAIAVAVENAGFGATWAAPIASLLMEKYLNDSISSKRKYLEEKMYKAHLINKYVYTIDSASRVHDAIVYQQRMERKHYNDSMKKAKDSIAYRNWVYKRINNTSH